MSALSEDKVLRLNCPGFGVSSTLALGEAKPLAMYEVIVVNPISVVHLFKNQSDQLKQIEVLQSDGMTSFRAEDDTLIDEIIGDFDIRAQELQQFLKKGGLLVYLLAPPFVVQGPSQQMDNYSWLGDWAPDKSAGSTQRNMSATIRGKAIETSADAEKSVWVPYLKQVGIEWSTIIRLENLTDGYVPLATAGPNKCISGFKSSGPKAGQVVFLPAPYNASFDGKLKECVDRWYALHCDDAPPPSALQDLSKGLSSLLSDDASSKFEVPPVPPNMAIKSADSPFDVPAPAPVAPPEIVAPAPPPEPTWSEVVPAASASVPEPVPPVAPPPAPEPVAAVAPPQPASEPAPVMPEVKVETNGSSSSSPAPVAAMGNDNHDASSGSDGGDLIRKMQQEISKPTVPEWCTKFSFEELDGLRQELVDVNEDVRVAQMKAQELGIRIQTMDDLKNSLLSASGEHLMSAATRVFERLGWQVKTAMGATDELWLMEGEKTQAIVRLIFCPAQPNRAELAGLAESVITYWGAHEIEPKGILLASTWAEKPPQDRPDDDFGDAMSDFAKRKNLCLLTTSQLLSIFRDLDISESNPKGIRDNLLTTSGSVQEYVFNKKGSTTAVRS